MDRADAVMAPEVALEGKQWSYMTGGGGGGAQDWEVGSALHHRAMFTVTSPGMVQHEAPTPD